MPDVAAALAREGLLAPEDLTRVLSAARDGDVASGRCGWGSRPIRHATAQDPLSAEAHYWLGHALSRHGLLFEAVAAFERASELRPDVAIVHQCLALTYERIGFQRSAREEWAHAIESCRDPRRKKVMQAHLETLLFL